MSGLVSLPPAADADPPAAAPPEVVTNDGWFPDIDLSAVRAVARIDTAITPARLRESAINAMSSVNQDLAAYGVTQAALGYANLNAVPASQIDGRSRLVHLYTRAIVSLVWADLGERMRDYGATAAGADRAEELGCSADDHRRNARWAVRDILGISRMTAELI